MSQSRNSKASEKDVDDSCYYADESSDNDDDSDSTDTDDEKEGSAVDNTIKKDGTWEEMFQRLLEFRNKSGHCLVPYRFKGDPQLGAWVAKQREHYRSKNTGRRKSTQMTSEREERLIAIGFEWSAKNPRCVPWEVRFIELLEFVVEYGHAQVPSKWKNNQLSNWVSAQRQKYKKQKGYPSRLTQERVALLNRIGFVWVAQRGGSRRQRTESEVPIPHTYQETPTGTDMFRRNAKTILQFLRLSNSTSASVVAGMPRHDQEQTDKTDSNTASNLHQCGVVQPTFAGFNDIAAGGNHYAPNVTNKLSWQLPGLSSQYASELARLTNPQRLEAPEMATHQALMAGYSLNAVSSFAAMNDNRHLFDHLSSRSSALSSYNLLNNVGVPGPLRSPVASNPHASNIILPQSLAQQTTIAGTAGVDSQPPTGTLFQRASSVTLPWQQRTVPLDDVSILRGSPQQQTTFTVMESPVVNHSANQCDDGHTPATRKGAIEYEDSS